MNLNSSDETIASLCFGQRAKRIVTKPIINTNIEYKLVQQALQQDLEDKTKKINRLENANIELMNKMNNLISNNNDFDNKHEMKQNKKPTNFYKDKKYSKNNFIFSI